MKNTELPKDSVLHIENVVMQFGGVVAVNNLNLDINKNEIVALIGPNGAGKTTAFNVVTGVYAPTNGCVYFNGEKIIENYPKGKMKKLYMGEHKGEYTSTIAPSPDKITKMGIARTFQNIRLFKELSVFENVLIAKHMRAKSNIFTATFRLNLQEERRQRAEVEELLRRFGLYEFRGEKASSLPYGEQRRLEIARALATDMKLLLLDEPAAGMNPTETEELLEIINYIRKEFKVSVLLIEHDMSLVMKICERIQVLDFGTTIASGTPEQIANDPHVIEAYLGVSDDAEN